MQSISTFCEVGNPTQQFWQAVRHANSSAYAVLFTKETTQLPTLNNEHYHEDLESHTFETQHKIEPPDHPIK